MRSSARFGIGRGRPGSGGRIVSVAIMNEQAGSLLLVAVDP
jgi:hypothetical protein